MTTGEDGSTAGGPPRGTVVRPPGSLRAFSVSATATIAVGLILTATTVGLVFAYAYRISVIHDIADQQATPTQIRNADRYVTWLYYATLAMSVAWIVAALMTSKRTMRMLGIEGGDARDQRRRYGEVLQGQPDWKLYGWWQKSIQVYFLITVLLRLVIPTTNTGTLAYVESVSRRGLILNIIDVVLLVAITVLGWRAKVAVESTAA